VARPKRISRTKSKDPALAATFALIDLVCEHEYEELDPIQRVAHLAFFYEAEVINGGHLQYFHNRGTEHVEETIDALESIEAREQSLLLKEAFERWTARYRERPQSLEDYHEIEIEHEFLDLDNRFYNCISAIGGLLQVYRQENESHFIHWLE
jgi:hypothetical protein